MKKKNQKRIQNIHVTVAQLRETIKQMAEQQQSMDHSIHEMLHTQNLRLDAVATTRQLEQKLVECRDHIEQTTFRDLKYVMSDLVSKPGSDG